MKDEFDFRKRLNELKLEAVNLTYDEQRWQNLNIFSTKVKEWKKRRKDIKKKLKRLERDVKNESRFNTKNKFQF